MLNFPVIGWAVAFIGVIATSAPAWGWVELGNTLDIYMNCYTDLAIDSITVLSLFKTREN